MTLIRVKLLWLSLSLLMPGASLAISPSFSGAEGFGALATGGQGGAVTRVTNLNDAGPGSFREAVSGGSRTIVFEVGGNIALKSPVTLHSDLTISGETAPPPGITLSGQELSFAGAHNVIMRFVRVRQGLTGRRGESAINTHGGSDMMFDHLSVSWGRWDTIDMNGCANITFQECLIGPGVNPQRFGCLCQGDGITFSHCLWIDNQSRNPKAKGRVQYINNVIYNWGVDGYVGGHSAAPHQADLINNLFIAGPSSSTRFAGEFKTTDQVYQTGNLADLNRDGKLDPHPVVPAEFGAGTTAPRFAAAPFLHPPIPVTVDTPLIAYAKIVAGVGDTRPRDAVDTRLIAQLTSLGKRGHTIENPAELTGQERP